MFRAFDWMSDRLWLFGVAEIGAAVAFMAICATSPIEMGWPLAGSYMLGAASVGSRAMRSALRSTRENRRR